MTNIERQSGRGLDQVSNSQRWITFAIVDPGGAVWRAVREPLGGGIYRTPDDPTTLQDVVDARIAHLRDCELAEQIELESRAERRT